MLSDVSQAQLIVDNRSSTVSREPPRQPSREETKPAVSLAPAFQSRFDGLPEIPIENPWGLETKNSSPTAPTPPDAPYITSSTPLPFQSVGYADKPSESEISLPESVEANEVWLLPSVVAGGPLKKGATQTRAPFKRLLTPLGVLGKFEDLSILPNLCRKPYCSDLGIGHERVMYAPHVVDTAIGTSNTGVLIRADRGLSTPDRLEAIWASPTRGPSPESRVDILDTVFRMEVGNSKLLAMTDYTMRSLNPDRNDNTTGFGDMILGAKATILDGPTTKVSSVFRTYLKTGPSDRGLGTGHVSLEPGLLLRHQLNQHTFFHGEAKYWLPIAGTNAVAGDVLKLGGALSTVWKETDSMALLPTIEFSSYTFLSGGATQANGILRRVNGEFAGELYPGMRIVHGPGNELGLLEYGFASGIVFADDGWFDTRLVFDIRFVR